MWYEINNDSDLQQFMEGIHFFHDSCIKEMCYLSGAYVNDDLSMFPLNNRRTLRVIIQRQCEERPMIEMEFQGLKFLKLFPVDENYTCEIMDSAMFLKDGCFYWSDSGELSEEHLNDYTGTIICSTEFRWRSIENCMGETGFYHSTV